MKSVNVEKSGLRVDFVLFSERRKSVSEFDLVVRRNKIFVGRLAVFFGKGVTARRIKKIVGSFAAANDSMSPDDKLKNYLDWVRREKDEKLVF